jgi:hypothetical protein
VVTLSRQQDALAELAAGEPQVVAGVELADMLGE